MPRPHRLYLCRSCGYESPRWLGRCPACGEWNAVEAVPEARLPSSAGGTARGALRPRRAGKGWSEPEAGSKALAIAEVDPAAEVRLPTGLSELDRVLGGGLVVGSAVLLGGEPGVGKSTLLLQVASSVAASGRTALYVSGEESPAQVRLRGQRLGALQERLLVLAETDFDRVEDHLEELRPALAVIDSVQTLQAPEVPSASGSVSQVRECGTRLTRLAHLLGTAVVMVGHVNKAGMLAGPKVLEHAVDVVLAFEGERHTATRMLRATKNRFGATDEVGLFRMESQGLVPLTNPSQLLLSERPEGAPGSVVVATLEGTRPLLVEVQALVAPSPGGVPPRRQATGIDPARLAIVLAVLERRMGLRLFNQEVFVSVAGGIRVEEPALDLGMAVAVASSLLDRPVAEETVVAGEVGLAGEVRSVAGIERRVAEARRLGFKRVVVPAGPAGRGLEAGLAGERFPEDGVLVAVRSVGEAFRAALNLPRRVDGPVGGAAGSP